MSNKIVLKSPYVGGSNPPYPATLIIKSTIVDMHEAVF